MGKGFNGKILRKLIANNHASVVAFSYLFTVVTEYIVLAVNFSRREPPALWSGL